MSRPRLEPKGQISGTTGDHCRKVKVGGSSNMEPNHCLSLRLDNSGTFPHPNRSSYAVQRSFNIPSDQPVGSQPYCGPATMTSSKFVEHLERDFQSTSPQLDVRLEDIIAESDLSSRARSTSGSSSGSSTSVNLGKDPSHPTEKVVSPKRRSRMFSLSGR